MGYYDHNNIFNKFKRDMFNDSFNSHAKSTCYARTG